MINYWTQAKEFIFPDVVKTTQNAQNERKEELISANLEFERSVQHSRSPSLIASSEFVVTTEPTEPKQEMVENLTTYEQRNL